MALLGNFFGDNVEQDTKNLVECVSAARAACKLRYIVGCAPVCYGVPVHLIGR